MNISHWSTEILFSNGLILVLVAASGRDAMRASSGWLIGWGDMMDIVIIALIAALILMTLFIAFMADGLEEYFRRPRTRRVGEESSADKRIKIPQSRLTP